MNKTKTHIVKSVGISNLPLTGKLCAVDSTNRKFKLGKLTFELDETVPILEIKEFVEEFLTFKIVAPLEDEYYEDVRIIYINTDTKVLDEVIKKFTGVVMYNNNGIVLQVGIAYPFYYEGVPIYSFRYFPQNLSMAANNFNLLELVNNV